MWDEWEVLASAQARADQQDAERREQRSRPKPPTPPHDPPGPPQAAVGWEADTWGVPEPRPLYAAGDPRNPDRPPIDVATGIRLYVKWLQNELEALEDTDE